MGHGIQFSDRPTTTRSLAYVELSADGSTRTITWLQSSLEFLSVVGASVVDGNGKAVIREVQTAKRGKREMHSPYPYKFRAAILYDA